MTLDEAIKHAEEVAEKNDGYNGGITVRHNADGTIMGYLGDKRRDREF